MSDAFLGEIRLFSMGFEPDGWLACNGQILQVNQYQALYSLLGNTYGGTAPTSFALPDLRGRVPVCAGGGMQRGMSAGEATHTLTINEIPMHTHAVSAYSGAANSASPVNNTWANGTNFFSETANVQLNQEAISQAGANKSHNNMQPYLVVNFCIASKGLYPPRS